MPGQQLLAADMGPTRSAAAAATNETEQLMQKVCANFVNQLEVKMDKKFEKFDRLGDQFNTLNKSIQQLINAGEETKKSIAALETAIDNLHQKSKQNSLRFHGIIEHEDENIMSVISNFINSTLGITCGEAEIDYAFRTGKALNDKPRSVVINFVRNELRNKIFRAKSQLKGSDVTVYEDLTQSRYDLLVKAKKKYGRNQAWSANGKVMIFRGNKKTVINSVKDL